MFVPNFAGVSRTDVVCKSDQVWCIAMRHMKVGASKINDVTIRTHANLAQKSAKVLIRLQQSQKGKPSKARMRILCDPFESVPTANGRSKVP